MPPLPSKHLLSKMQSTSKSMSKAGHCKNTNGSVIHIMGERWVMLGEKNVKSRKEGAPFTGLLLKLQSYFVAFIY
ncbi:unnamed protein product [Rhizophagus irregularis]|nr:unnamed protein product [Rhizophagus irregularis]